MTKKSKSMANSQEALFKAQGRRLHKALQGQFPELTLAQALEALSRSQGNRTLHVQQAKKPIEVEGAPLRATATRMAERMFFRKLGHWQGKTEMLFAELDIALLQLDEKGEEHVDARIAELLNGGSLVRVTPPYEHLTLKQWRSSFDTLVRQLCEELAKEAQVADPDDAAKWLFRGLVRDWRVVQAPEDIQEKDTEPFDVTVQLDANRQQLYVDFQRPGLHIDDLDDTVQATLFIEVNQGVPCVHLGNSIFGDQVLSVFFTEDGLYLRPERASDGPIVRGVNPRDLRLLDLHETLNAPFPAHAENEVFTISAKS